MVPQDTSSASRPHHCCAAPSPAGPEGPVTLSLLGLLETTDAQLADNEPRSRADSAQHVTCPGELTAWSIKLWHMSMWGPGALYTGWANIQSALALSPIYRCGNLTLPEVQKHGAQS